MNQRRLHRSRFSGAKHTECTISRWESGQTQERTAALRVLRLKLLFRSASVGVIIPGN
jgi:hypothetical protein